MTKRLHFKNNQAVRSFLPIFLLLLGLWYPKLSFAESYTLSVGENVTISQTAYNGGYIDNVGLADYLDPHLGFTKNYDGSATITVNSYFDYTANIKLVFIERYQSYYNGRNHTLAYTYYKDVSIKCRYQAPDPSKKPTKVILPERIRVNVYSGGDRDYITPILEPNGAKGTTYYWGNDQGTAVFAARTMDDGRCWVTGRSPGIGRVYVVVDDDWDKLYASAVLEVVDPNHLPPNSVFLPSEIEISVNGFSTLTPTLVPENTSTAFTWKSEDESIATVSYGKVTGKKVGTTTIKVTTTNQLTATCTVKVVSRNGKDDEDSGDNNTDGSVGGHNYVDLGLSVKWATCNVGANNPEGFGSYYAWGETTEKSSYTWSTYKHCGGSILNVYDIGSDIKGTSYDAAYVNWGSDWRMPTEIEMGELVSKCTFKEETQNGVDGYLVTGPNGSSVFLPTAGVMKDKKEGGCRYWTSTVHSGDYGMSLLITKNKNNVISPSVTSQMRSFGLPIRAVTTASDNSTTPKLVLSALPSGGQVSAGTKVTLTAKASGSTVSGCDIYYTLNGTTPSKSNGTKYSSDITINSACTLKAIAYKSGYTDSDVLTEKYTIKEDPKPKLVLSASPSSGQVAASTKVTLTVKADGSTVSGCDIYYTLNGSTPSKSNGTKYSSGITINSACTLKAIAYKSGYTDSDVLTEKYTIKEDPKPKLVLSASPSSGQVSAGTKVTLTAKANGSTVSGCDIYYTTDGTTPSRNNGKEYSSGITINSACTLKAIAYKSGYEDSDVLTASFTTRNGNTFDALTIEGVLVTYYIISEKDKTCQVGGNWIHAIPESTTGKLTIPSSVNGYSVIKIAERAFAMSKIESIFIPKTITDIRYNGEPFGGCAKLANITVEAGNNYYDSRQGCNAIIETSTNKLIVGGKNTTIPNTVVAIGYEAFGSREIRDVTIPNSVKIIEATAFSSSTLQSITIPNSVTKIGNNAFGYTRLSAIAIPASVKEIESNLFVGCTYLNKIVVDANNSVYDSRNDCNAIIETASNTLICGCKSSVIPSTIVNIRSYAFLNQQISVITIPNSVKTIGESAFVGCWPKTIISKIEAPFKIEEKVFYYSLFSSHNPYNVSTLIVPSGTKSLYETTEGWNKFKKIVESCKIVLTASPSGGEVQKGTIVRLTANVDDAEIYYALGDNDSYHKYSSENGILISESVKLYASAHKDGFEDSDVLAIDYKVKEKIILSATPSGGNVENGTKVYLKTQNTTDCDIYYTLDGSMPTKNSKKHTSSGIVINEDCTLKAIAYKDGYEDSDLLTAIYIVKKKLELSATPSSGEVEKGTTIFLTAKANGKIVGGSIPSPSGEANGDGSLTNPFNAIAAINYTSVLAADVKSENEVYIKGIISRIPNNGTFEDSRPYGNATFYISENGAQTNEFYIFRTLYLGNVKYTSGTDIKVGDEVIICGKVVNYKGNTPETQSGESYVFSLNGKTSDDGSTASSCDIYYTLDGTKPSKSSTKYTSAGIAINEDCTLKAIAYKDGYETSDILTETYTIKKEDIRLAITSSGYATFYSSMSAYTLPNDLSAKVVKEAGNGKLTYETIIIIDGSNVNIVPKGVPVMIESNNKQARTYTLTAVTSNSTYTGTNLLRGSDEPTTTMGDGNHYKLSYGPTGTKWDDVFGWYWGSQNGAPFQIEGHKAWLVIPKNGTRAAGFTIEGDVLGIESLEELSETPSDLYFDLQGRRISQPTKRGVYIKNGMKVIFK